MFLAVADNSSFTLAGRQLNVAQSAVSRKIKMLEVELGESLFRRINKRVYLTQAGETLAHRARTRQDRRRLDRVYVPAASCIGAVQEKVPESGAGRSYRHYRWPAGTGS